MSTAVEIIMSSAQDWREYVRDPSQWREDVWEAAQERGLVIRRTEAGRKGHKWVLTDKGLDLMNEGKWR